MADRVNEIMEAMVPELEDLRKRGLCTVTEVKALVKRRENAEYSMNRRQPKRSDFLTAVQLEMNLEALIRVRRKRIGLPRRGAADYAVRKRVHFVFDRALRKFPGDEELWLQWINYAERTRARSRLSRVFARAIAMLPTSAALWLRAANWEFEGRHNLSGARSLLQRALRLNGDDGRLWAAYFRLELLGLHKLSTRRQQLGLGKLLVDDETGGDDDAADSDADTEDEGDDDALGGDDDALGGAGEGAAGAAGAAPMDLVGGGGADGHSEDGSDGADDVSLGTLEIPWLVFHHLQKSLPARIDVQLDCLRTCLDFPGTGRCAARARVCRTRAWMDAPPRACRDVARPPSLVR